MRRVRGVRCKGTGVRMRLLVSGNTVKFATLRSQYEDVLGMLVTPSCGRRVSGMVEQGLPWAADNGAYSGFTSDKFRRFLERIAFRPGCVFLAVPDVVGDAKATIFRFHEWALECRATGQPLAFVGQDGVENEVIDWNLFDAFFIGGSTKWKESQAAGDLTMEAKRRGKWAHMGRVNSRRRMRIAMSWGCDSCDGTGMSKFGDKCLGGLLRWRRELEKELALPDLFAE